jgi:hypothetical protein
MLSMNRDTHHRRDRRVAVHHQVAPAHHHRQVVARLTITHHRRAVAEAVQVAVLEAEAVRGAEAPEVGVEAFGSAISMNMVRGVEAPEAGLVAVQAVAREAAQVAVLEAEAVAVARARVEVAVRVVQAAHLARVEEVAVQAATQEAVVLEAAWVARDKRSQAANQSTYLIRGGLTCPRQVQARSSSSWPS